jgi:antitoxin (DNA-binding transcriptional repressor) of toxin-antitoxin stability system
MIRTPFSILCALFLILQLNIPPALAAQEDAEGPAAPRSPIPACKQPCLIDGTAVRLQFAETVSSADAHVGDRVQFEVLDDVKVGDTVVIAKGGVAWGSVTAAQPKRRMARGGKLDIVVDSVRLADGDKAAIRATKEALGGSHTGRMAAGMVVTGLIVWPAAPLFLLMHGKNVTISNGTEVSTFVNGDFELDLSKFDQAAPGSQGQAAISPGTSAMPQPTIASRPAGTD